MGGGDYYAARSRLDDHAIRDRYVRRYMRAINAIVNNKKEPTQKKRLWCVCSDLITAVYVALWLWLCV